MGTFTHAVSYWTSERVAAWLRRFYDQQGNERAERLVRAAVEAFVAENLATVYCTVCGEQVPRRGEPRAQWGKIRRCGTCLAAGRSAVGTKFCRSCRMPMPRQDAYDAKVWASLSTCAPCRELNSTLDARATAVARSIREGADATDAKSQYLDALSPKLKRRIRR
ncbi:MAG: hypothetical protein NUV84_05680 [Candidatus Uhrbacteria bacterium]|nr:hypothetical protein [Candidatus Uhrbacteria bacterium]